jgi:GNAT superfamily N-acetyltransferase
VIALAVTDAPTEADRSAVLAGLESHSAVFVGEGAFTGVALGVLLRDATGTIVGGLIGRSALRWLFIDLVHVDAALRGGGHGRRLLLAAEDTARARGCVGIRLDTFSFQAPGFYARCGYAEYGRLEDHPPGHTRHFFFKRLDGGPTCST